MLYPLSYGSEAAVALLAAADTLSKRVRSKPRPHPEDSCYSRVEHRVLVRGRLALRCSCRPREHNRPNSLRSGARRDRTSNCSSCLMAGGYPEVPIHFTDDIERIHLRAAAVGARPSEVLPFQLHIGTAS